MMVKLNAKDKRKQRIAEVASLLEEFCAANLSDEVVVFVQELWKRLGRKRTNNITGGKPEIWASAVVYVIARLNFLFDKTNEEYISPDVICEFFGTKKRTVAARASEIQKRCRINIGEPGLCRRSISDMLTIVEFPNGLVLPLDVAREMGLVRE